MASVNRSGDGYKPSFINRLRDFARGIVDDVVGVFWGTVDVGAYTFLIPLYALVLVPGAIIIQGLRHTLRNFYDSLVAALRVPFFLVRKLLYHIVLPAMRWLLESLEATYNRVWTDPSFSTVSFLLLILAALLGAVAYLQLFTDSDLAQVARRLSSLI